VRERLALSGAEGGLPEGSLAEVFQVINTG
jgi:hypothetical protein